MFQPVRGTQDFIGHQMRHFRWVTDQAREVASYYGFQEMMTPIFEFSKVFDRLGQTSDVVSKETYHFQDRGGESLTLRPEGTAPVARAVLSNGLTQEIPLKFFYAGPMFRYDRPQKGRYRQFHHIGVELIGIEQAQADIEVIALGAHILKSLGILDKTNLELNTLGDAESRQVYRKNLILYFQDHRASLSEESQKRLKQNPLRILDSKEEQDQKIVQQAPLYTDFLTPLSQDFFGEVIQGLDLLGIQYKLNPHLVRGLDYYCHTAFEFITPDLGAQSAVLAGGRYNGLLASMGGPDLPAVGWAAGVERLMMLSQLPNEKEDFRPLALIPIGTEAEIKSFQLLQEWRHQGLYVDMAYTGSVKKRMKRADKIHAKWAIFLGETELKAHKVLLRYLDTGQEVELPLTEVYEHLKDLL